jgi:hypothetical protein
VYKNNIYNSCKVLFGATLLVAIFTQLLTFRQTPANFFSYFTVLSNLFVAVVFILESLSVLPKERLDMMKGAGTLYLLITGFGFTVLLGGNNDEFLWWTNIILHYISPIVVLLDWICTSAIKISFQKSLLWIAPLLLYVVYTLVRGSIISWYPYGFLNPNEIGYIGVFRYLGIMLTGSLIINWILTKQSGKIN